MRIEPDTWLADIFGYPVFRVSLQSNENYDAAQNITAGKLHAASEGRQAFFYAKVPTTRVADVEALYAVGFNVVDVSVSLERHPDTLFGNTNGGKVIIRDARPEDHDAVLDMAFSCFIYSRFHLDPAIPTELANTIKRQWIHNYILGRRGERLVVAEHDGTPAAFLAILAANSESGRMGLIDLVGVEQKRRRLGIGQSLLEFFIRSAAGSYSLLRVGTQAANIPSMRMYEKCGFRSYETTYVLHLHMPYRRNRG